MTDQAKNHWEDFQLDRTVTFGHYEVTKDEIIAFASEFDPQPFHLDEEAARATPFGGLVASGWHSCAIFMRMIYDGVLANAASLGAPGLAQCRWLKPVRPGDQLSGRYTCIEKRVSQSMPNVGIVEAFDEGLNQDGTVVLDWRVTQFFRCREAAHAS